MNLQRREAVKTIIGLGTLEFLGAGILGRASVSDFGVFLEGGKHFVRAAAVQMKIRHGDVDANLATAERLVEMAISDGATWITLPEFFTTGFGAGNDPAFLDAHCPLDGEPKQLLVRLAKRAGGVVGGSFLAQRDQDTYNTYVLALADGRTFTHDKDTPSMGTEASCYIGGDDDGCMNLGEPNIAVGVAMCWELIRVRTARRLRERVDVILAGSAYFDSEELYEEAFRNRNSEILTNMPRKLAKLTGAPVVHANPVGQVRLGFYSAPLRASTVEYMGQSQIVNASGETLGFRSHAEGEGVVVATLELHRQLPSAPLPDSFWIPEIPDEYAKGFASRSDGAKTYWEQTRPYRNRTSQRHIDSRD
ncbi:MAG: carbon-nitrogen hydrolase family protein [Planctomycetales bacterium]|nr:carbon-nitrogen hydrolase family protein [Planctomycetales bacterium]